MRRFRLGATFLALAFPLGHSPALAIIHGHVEDFSTTTFLDRVNSTALWDTVGRRIGLPPFPLTTVGAFDTPDRAAGLVVRDHLAFVADRAAGLQIVDVSEPAAPRRVGALAIPGDALDVAVQGDFAYVAAGSAGLAVIGISDPENPVLLGVRDTPGVPRGLAVADRYAYLADDVLRIVNVTYPTSPFTIGIADTPGEPYQVAVSGHFAYVADGSGGLGVYDVANPAFPVRLGGAPSAGYTMGVAIAGDRAYVADGAGGLRVYDITIPAQPALAGSFMTPTAATRVGVLGDFAFVATGASGMVVLDLSALPDITLAGSLDTPDWALDVATDDLHAYVADRGSGLQIVDVFGPWAASGPLSISSLSLTSGGAPIRSVRLVPSQVDSISWEVSADGGAHWHAARVDSSWTPLPEAGQELRWRSHHLYRYPGRNPACTRLHVQWTTQDTLLLRPDGTGSYPTIQAAIDAAAEHDVIVLADGVYRGPGNRDLDFREKSITLMSGSDDPESCIIDCEGTAESPHRGLHLYSRALSRPVVRGVTITRGFTAHSGAGMLISGSCIRPELQNCIVSNCVSPYGALSCGVGPAGDGCYEFVPITMRNLICRDNTGGGAAIWNSGIEIRVQESSFDHNSGYGLWCEGLLRMTSSTMSGNGAHGLVVGMAGYSDAVVDSCTFTHNGQHGVMLYIGSDGPCTISNCVASDNGGDGINSTTNYWTFLVNDVCERNGESGIDVEVWPMGFVDGCILAFNGEDGLTIRNSTARDAFAQCTLYGNAGAGIRVGEGPDTELARMAIVGNAGPAVVGAGSMRVNLVASAVYGNLGGDWTGPIVDQDGDDGNLSRDPLFCAPAAGDFQLRANSPCAAENNEGVRIGALGVGCAAVARVELLRAGHGVSSCALPAAVSLRYEPISTTPAVRGYSVRIRALGGMSFGAGDIAVLGVPEGAEWFHQVVEHTPGDCTVDYTLLGQATGGIVSEAVLFTVLVRGVAEGSGAIEVVSADLRDLQNQPVSLFASSRASFQVDCTAPPAVAGLAAVGGHERVGVMWTDPVAADLDRLEVWRAVWHVAGDGSAYPEYDDVPGVLPARPASREAAAASGEWQLAGAAAPGRGAFVDTVQTRGVYCYEVFGIDGVGNAGPPAETGARALNYWLGDFRSPGGGPDGYVNVPDLTTLGAAYGTTPVDAAYDAECDIGPTSDSSGSGIPLTDDAIDFDDLMIVGLNFGEVEPKSHGAAGAPIVVEVEWHDEVTWSLALRSPCPNLLGLHVTAGAPPASVVVADGELLARLPGPVFLRNVSAHGLDAGLAFLGGPPTIAGELMRVTLGAVGLMSVRDLVVEARNTSNLPIPVLIAEVTAAPTPVAYRLEQNAPNPFNPATTIRFSLPRRERVRLSIFDLTGRLVRVLVNEEREAGDHEVSWEGLSDRHQAMGSGVYVCRLEAGACRLSRRLTLVR